MNSDSIGLAYLRLAFHIDHHIPGFIDAYFGRPEWKAQAEAEGKLSPTTLRHQAESLLQELGAVSDMNEMRCEWLTRHVTAMMATLRRLEGETLPFEEELRLVYDIQPQWTDEREFEEALRMMDDLLPGSEPLVERLEAWDKQFEVAPERVLPLMERCCEEARRRTGQLFNLPEGEAVDLRTVTGQPWSAYNWYLGDYRSRVEINTDLPVRANTMLLLMTHECYPGHHTEHAIKEQRLYRQQGRVEACVQLINAPECVISEGIADLAWEMIFTEQELKTWLREDFYPQAGLSPDLVARDRAIAHARRRLRPVTGNAAFLLHRDGAGEQTVIDYIKRYSATTDRKAMQSYRFISNPLFRTYVFNYHYGRELLSRYVEAGDRVVRFQTLLEQPLTPSRVEQWVRAA